MQLGGVGLGLTRHRKTGAGGPSVAAKPTAFSENFNSQANGTLLRNIAGFTVFNQAGGTTADRDRWAVNASGQIACSANDGGDPGLYIGTHDTGSTDHVLRIKFVTGNNNMRLVVGAVDEKNCLALNISAGTNSWTLRKWVAGVATTLASGNYNTSGSLNRALATGDVIELRTLGTKLHLLLAGVRITAAGGVDITGVTKGNLAGLGNYFSSGVVYDDFYCAPLTNNLEFTSSHTSYSQEGTAQAFPIFWPASRSTGKRGVPLAGTYVNAPTSLQARVLNASTLAVVQDWAAMTGVTASAGVWTGTASVNRATATNPNLLIQVRDTGDGDAVAQSTSTTVGYVGMFWGQSNAGTGHESATSYNTTNSYSWSTNAGNVWHGGPNTVATQSNTAITASVLAQADSAPWGVMGYGTSGTYIAELLASGAGTTSPNGQYYDDMLVTVKKANAYGYVDFLMWEQGENEAYVPVSLGSAGTVYGTPEQTAYASNIDTMLTRLRTELGRSDAPCLFYIIGWNNEKTVADGGSYTGTYAQLNANYRAQRQLFATTLAAKTGCSIGAHMRDTTMVDSFHYTSDSYKERNRRMGLSALKALGLSTTDGRGPIITGATRSGATITLAVNLNGATSISGTGLTNYEVSTDNFATTKTITSVDVSGGNIVITLAADPGAPVKVRSFATAVPPTAPAWAIGTYADASTIPVAPIDVELTSN